LTFATAGVTLCTIA